MLSDFFKTHEFQMLVDETLRGNACKAVEHFLQNNTPVKRAQLHAIPLVIQADGLAGLTDLIKNQKSKNTKIENKVFWEYMGDVVLTTPGPEFSLRVFLKNQPQVVTLLQDEAGVIDKNEAKKIRKANKVIMDQLLGHVLKIYFEHFNCHYYYLTRQGVSS